MKSFRVILPYVCIRDAIMDYEVIIKEVANEEEAIRRAAFSMAESDAGCGGPPEDKRYISLWQRAKAGERFDYEDLVPTVIEVLPDCNTVRGARGFKPHSWTRDGNTNTCLHCGMVVKVLPNGKPGEIIKGKGK